MLDQGMGHGPRTLTLWQVRAVCTQREPTGGVIIVIVAEKEEKREREERREREREKEEEERRKRERRGDERKSGRERSLPCVGSKRLRV